MTLLALVFLIVKGDILVIRTIAVLLLVLAIILIFEAVRAFGGERVVEDELPDEGPTVPADGKVC